MPDMSAVAVEERKEKMSAWRVLWHPKDITNGKQFLEAVEREGMIVCLGDDDVPNTIAHPKYKAREKEFGENVLLALLVTDEHGLGSGPKVSRVCEYALECLSPSLPLKKCPLWVPPILRLCYPSQPDGESLIVVTEDLILPSACSGPEMFCVLNYDGTRRLTTCPFSEDRILPPGTTLVFAMENIEMV